MRLVLSGAALELSASGCVLVVTLVWVPLVSQVLLLPWVPLAMSVTGVAGVSGPTLARGAALFVGAECHWCSQLSRSASSISGITMPLKSWVLLVSWVPLGFRVPSWLVQDAPVSQVLILSGAVLLHRCSSSCRCHRCVWYLRCHSFLCAPAVWCPLVMGASFFGVWLLLCATLL